MIAQTIALNPSQDCHDSRAPCWHQDFLKMVPKIEEQASYMFRHLKGDNRDDAIQEVVCSCCLAFARLVELNRAEAATWSSLAKYAIAQVRDGRRVGCSLNIKDISSEYCQMRKGLHVCRLHHWDNHDQTWQEVLVEDKNATPADLAASRIDFPAWLQNLSERDRKIALRLSEGESTSMVARLFRISAARISQLRHELRDAWEAFHGKCDSSSVEVMA